MIYMRNIMLMVLIVLHKLTCICPSTQGNMHAQLYDPYMRKPIFKGLKQVSLSSYKLESSNHVISGTCLVIIFEECPLGYDATNLYTLIINFRIS